MYYFYDLILCIITIFIDFTESVLNTFNHCTIDYEFATHPREEYPTSIPRKVYVSSRTRFDVSVDCESLDIHQSIPHLHPT